MPRMTPAAEAGAQACGGGACDCHGGCGAAAAGVMRGTRHLAAQAEILEPAAPPASRARAASVSANSLRMGALHLLFYTSDAGG
ncbi:hypothetical protein PPH41_18230, partial [Burkholderia gladioli]|nr:hypothetical protein [Burkholderia gladioli]